MHQPVAVLIHGAMLQVARPGHGGEGRGGQHTES